MNRFFKAASQLSRNIENRADKSPQLSDLRESGSIEQDATIVNFIQHVWKDNDREQWATLAENLGSNGRLAPGAPFAIPIEIVVAKHRNGQTGTTQKIKWHKPTNTFTAFGENE
jgi:replicative DNA helicase